MPTKAQYGQLVTQRRKVYTLQTQIMNLQAQQVYESLKFQEMSKKVILDNRWPADVQFDSQSLMFVQRSAVQAKQTEGKPSEPAKPESPK